MRKARIAFAAAVVTVGLGLSGCNDGGDDSGSSDKAKPEASATESPAKDEESPAADEGSGDDGRDAPAGDVAKPGTKLKVGDRAVLPFEYTSEKKGTVAVTVTEIAKGAESDMSAFGEKAKGMTPYYIKMKVENVGGTDLTYASLKLDGVLEGGGGTGVVLIGDIPGKCDSESAPAEFKTKGASYETCTLTASKGAPVTSAEFDEGDAYSDNPVVWGS
ncbi:hypothetical protein DSC45_29165 [Streptomyces sp. YIM 130001]|uniref:hypothetical protein n=1 Tax=Streptomyces sp. YIM 130001 TaxID=2259644 RepID=UPI000E64CBEC|nr:hypothetical protein [Streptomyces sp. YIM 130001]RII11225.1 hypothetical protein DSC45_29165 [Streptomyces sp. YIM 130001]